MHWKVSATESNKYKKETQSSKTRFSNKPNATKTKKKELKKNKQNLQEVWDYVKQPSLRIIGVPKEKEKSKSVESIFEEIIWPENFPGLAIDLDIQTQKAQRTTGNFITKRLSPRHVVIRFPKVKMKETRAVRQSVR